ncbi:MAG TPA: glycosyltransferase [candidate division Zixibacteria bacterium]|nr:glycosyltransferase [candidate division Zixibacteria bacterium]
MNRQHTLVFITSSYPYYVAAEESFVRPELEYLSSFFDRIIIVPDIKGGNKEDISPKIEVEDSYSSHWLSKPNYARALWSALSSTLFYKELIGRPSLLIKPRALKSLMSFVAGVKKWQGWLTEFLRQKKIDINECLFYTYWLESFTLGIGMARESYPQLKLVSRAHRYDVYEDRRPHCYMPCRALTLKCLDRLFVISEDGRNYITRKYPWFSPLCEVSRLGVKGPGFVTPSSQDGIFRMASCSSISRTKRIDLLLEGLIRVAMRRPGQVFEWSHIGDGPMEDQLAELAVTRKQENLKIHFKGKLPNEGVIAFYKSNPVDIFINTSRSEGIPVSIMEAQSCAIPVVATDVGGTREIVSDQNGRLLQTNPSPEEISDAILFFLDNPSALKEMKKLSQDNWANHFNADLNYASFLNRLKSIL